MLRVKKLDLYVVKSFVNYFLMTLFIVILILLMQFVWKHMSELIGKGIDVVVLAEFLWYAVLNTIPMALPLAILLASLMSFGNLGEYSELTAMKSAGISLFKIMRGLIVFIISVCIAAFFFSNNVLPLTQTKLYTLLFSLQEKSPEFEIPESEFYTGIGGYNLYVTKKEKEKKLLVGIMIYDFSKGFNNAAVILADSGRVQFTADNKYLKLLLYNGESFENLNENNSNTKNIPYRRETFGTKKILIDFDTEFNRFDESIFDNEYISKDVVQLSETIDSLNKLIGIRETGQAKDLISYQPISSSYYTFNRDTLAIQKSKLIAQGTVKSYNPDSLFYSFSKEQMIEVAEMAKQEAQAMKDKVLYNKIIITDPTANKRYHSIELHRKFTLSIACLIFFFIGAPLGAIIRKGGLGLPIVISVLLFVIYYIIDTTGYKMAREGIWETYQGMWLSSSILFPFGIFLTWKAVTDASMFKTESYTKLFEAIKHYINKFVKKSRE